ncbi:iron transporter FeoB [candidate division TA06 bacterium DG_78]|uniref:Iron transporter FeoB n=1 Tax=candidate division TA06 bacterium DG_78 TaxID=1703772 RepID=A0A0S7YJ91_UNCT6|nr:MAG: iron transporter FeoB [candidate division TA06 bacterium DG_78]
MKKILLMGNPNVGKSVIFSRLTGVDVIASNYPGTTVEFCKGCVGKAEQKADVIDVPGTYTLEPTSPAEQVAVELLNRAIEEKDSIVINVIDATNLERNLNLTLQLLKREIPVIIALNLWDEAKHIGISIDVEKLEQILGVPIIPTVAITGEGIKQLVTRLGEAKKSQYQYEDKERWHEVGNITNSVQVITHKHHTIGERLGDLTIHPWTGIPIAIGVMLLVFAVIRFIGEGLIGYIFEPLFENLWSPVMMALSRFLGGQGIIHNILIGQLIEGEIDFGQSFGLLTTGLFVPIAAVLPYIIAFYLVLSFLEDSGYLPRLAVLLDKLMHTVGLHGMAIVPMMLGLGCNVPGALSTRVLESKRERFIAATLMSIAIPCMAQIAMIFGLIGKFGIKGMSPVFGTLFIVWFVFGFLMSKIIKGESPEIFTEIPPYRLPYFGALLKKVWMRIKWFLREAIPFVLLGVFIVNILYSFGIIAFLGKIAAPIVTNLLGLPLEAVGALIIGFLRKDLAVGMLAPLGLSLKQLIVACVVLAMYFPCVATFAVLLKELGIIDMIKAAIIMIVSSFLIGALLNLIL